MADAKHTPEDRCEHGVRFPHECRDCADSVQSPGWLQGVNAGTRHWVVAPGAVKGINAGNADRAALIVRAVNNHEALVTTLRDLLDSLRPAMTDTIIRAHAVLAKATGSHA